MTYNVSKIVRNIITEATGQEEVDQMTYKIMDLAVNTLDPSLVVRDYEQAEKQYYSALRDELAKELSVKPQDVGKYLTKSMELAFMKKIEKYRDKLLGNSQSADNYVQNYQKKQEEEDKPDFLNES